MATDKKMMDELEKRRAAILAAGGEDKLEKRRAKGLMTARDRVDGLYDAHSFQEVAGHAKHHCTRWGMDKKVLPGDGIITGAGLVDGRQVAVASQDFTLMGGSLGNMHAQKMADSLEFAGKVGCPFIAFNDSGGARIQEGVESLSGYGHVFYKNVYLSGVVPQIAVICGPCAGGAAYSPALMDFLIMTKESASMFITGPEVIKAVTGEICTMAEVGSAAAHATVSGNIHFVANDDAHALQITKKLLSFLPSNNMEDPPHDLSVPLDLADDPSMEDVVPEAVNLPLDVQQVIARIVDNADFLEVQKDWAKNIVVGFARIGGVCVGIIANQPAVKAGTLDIDASDKAARFIRFCNAFNMPLVNLVDVPGFLPGVQQERGGIIRHGAKLLFAYASATVPKITMILRKAYGGAYIAMCCKELGADKVFAWPTAEIAVMGAQGATNVLYRREIKAADDPAAKTAELQAEYSEAFANPYQAASLGMVTDVIKPAETRRTIALALRSTLSKRETRPGKKHGNIPL